ncbi:DUF6183 family protein [Streptomyces sp. NBC_01483]|uniref:DUF6183 family protein n=1 Tax=Streptomyces sp. NBC_01483 TaxID=2903883 RepID=UPI002E2F053E|nr:DUF6183 family protein [Streptomyces sp. NBC_01483]
MAAARPAAGPPRVHSHRSQSPPPSVRADCSTTERSGLRDIATTDIRERRRLVRAGEWGAYGRLWAWRSMAGLSGAPAGARGGGGAPCAAEHMALHLEAYADWFHNDIDADYGIAALSPDCRRIAVLAATDTDWRYSRIGALPRT